jgi:putative membrane protein
MSYLTGHWAPDPFLIIAIILAVWHEIGLARLARRDGERAGQRRMRSLAFYAGLAVALAAVDSPVEYWSARYFFMHMVQHLLLMFAAPTLIVAGAPWQPLLSAIPGRAAGLGWARPLRAACGWLLRPWVSVVAFNLVMLIWHVPALLDLAENNQAVQVWLLHSSYLIAGILFWLQFIPSPPFRARMLPEAQAAALVATNVIMWLLAMAMSFLTSVSWYSVYDHVPGVTLPP